LPVWLLLCPRDHLSSFLKIGTIGLLVLGVCLANPVLEAPAVNHVFVSGGGPNMPGPIFPYLFICIMCGAISGFHALVSSGTTPKMVDKETQCRSIGYGAMLMESLVGVTALIAACSLPQPHYYAINLKPEAFALMSDAMKANASELVGIAHMLGESHLEGRTGGGVSLAVGIATMFKNFPLLSSMMAFFYHFVIMFEALFILTTIDTGTRIARFLVQEFMARVPKSAQRERSDGVAWGGTAAVCIGAAGTLLLTVSASQEGHAPSLMALVFAAIAIAGIFLLATSSQVSRTDWIPASVAASMLVVAGWSYFIYTGSIQTLWPMFGVANQLLAVVALTVATTVLINEGRSKYAWVTIVPMLFVGTTTLTAGYMSIRDIFLPMRLPKPDPVTKAMVEAKPALIFQGTLLTLLTVVMMLCVVAVLADAVPRWIKHWNDGRAETREALRLPSEEAAAEVESIGILEPSL
jgi:carbon starvation protein